MENNMFETLKMFLPWAKTDSEDFKEAQNKNLDSVTAPKFDDGAIEVETNSRQSDMDGSNFFWSHALSLDLNPHAKNLRDLIGTYRSLMNIHEVDTAVSEIVDDAIVYEDGHDVVSLDLSGCDFSENIKTKINDELKTVLGTLEFSRKGSDHFRRWYVDSRIFFHKVVNPDNLKEGIVELRRLDPRGVQFIREVLTDEEQGTTIVKGYKEFFIYDTGAEGYSYLGRRFSPNSKIKIPKSAIVYAHSGLVDCDGKNIIGYLHRAVKPANQLKLLEDAMVIYRITRAPERRIFYIDTGDMPNRMASSYMNRIMNNMKNRVVYDASTGKIKNQQHNMSMTEDYWLQRRDGKAVTDVSSLPGATGMNEIEDVRWFNKKLYEALRVPLTRIPNDQGSINVGFNTEITRDELKFSKFIRTLLHKFEEVILDPLGTNLILKKILTKEEWDKERHKLKVVFNKDSYFTEIKDAELTERRINILQMAEPFIGKYISHYTAMKDFLKFSDEQIKEESEQIKEESKDPRFNPQEEEF